jgi:hypothetical protein
MGCRKRRKQHFKEAATAVSDDIGNSKQPGSSDMVHMMAAASSKRQVRPPMDHFEKLKDCGMMKNFMALGSLVQSMEVDKVPKGVA